MLALPIEPVKIDSELQTSSMPNQPSTEKVAEARELAERFGGDPSYSDIGCNGERWTAVLIDADELANLIAHVRAEALREAAKEPMPRKKYETLQRRHDYLKGNQHNNHTAAELSALSWVLERHAPNAEHGERCNPVHQRNVANNSAILALTGEA